MFNQRNLEACFNGARETNSKYVGVLIKTPESEKVVICGRQDFDHEENFYKENYTDDLRHKHASDLEIIGFTFGNSYSVIEYDLLVPEKYLKKSLTFSLMYANEESRIEAEKTLNEVFQKIKDTYVTDRTEDVLEITWS